MMDGRTITMLLGLVPRLAADKPEQGAHQEMAGGGLRADRRLGGHRTAGSRVPA